VRRPTRVLLWISVFLGLVCAAVALLFDPLQSAFMANIVFNGLIVGVLLIGITINVRQVMLLGPDATWIRAYRAAQVTPTPPRQGVLGSLARLLSDRGDGRLRLSAISMRTLLDSIRSRLEEGRDLGRYFIGLLIFLGLLGTFWGLLDTLRAIAEVIRDLRVSGSDASAVFGELRAGLEAPLSGMGTAFSSSLFGLAGALVLGFVDLQAGHAQNRFYNDLEEWLSGLTQYSGAAPGGGDYESSSAPAYIQALLEQTSDGLDRLQRIITKTEEERRSSDRVMITLAEEIEALIEHTRSEQKTMLNVVRGSSDLHQVLLRMTEALERRQGGEDTLHEVLLRLDLELARMNQLIVTERGDVADRLGEEVRLLTRTIARQQGDIR
jgi:ABC-type multidrug transport system fused ATPase/permease subunit